jgi:hypothetical protein
LKLEQQYDQVVLRHGPRAQVLIEKERKKKIERAYLNSHRTPDRQEKYSRYNRLTLAPRHKLLQHKYWSLRQEGSGDTVALTDDTPGQGQTARI